MYHRDSPMLFNSGTFLFFFMLFMTGYAFLWKSRGSRMWYLLAFSLFFYYKSSGAYLLLMLFTITLDYVMSMLIHREFDEKKRKRLLIFSIVLSLLPLLGFKYTNFFLSNWYALRGMKFDKLDIFLPIGISFYTFQAISYIVDVYHRKIKPAEKLMDYMFYMTFFPHLVAGPIVRAKDFLPQLRKQKPLIDRDNIDTGLILVFKGLLKKSVIADYLAQYNDLVFAAPSHYSGFENLLAMYGYAIQIYCDFSAYSDMAIGFAWLMGYYLKPNFNSPYVALNITDFWRRWHISLSSWLRDYIYIPLGGNRKGENYQYLFLMITMLIGGLWHGADWKFVWWGGMHGLALVIHKLYLKFVKDRIPDLKIFSVISWLITFHFVAFMWLFFRAASFSDAIDCIKQIFGHLDLAYLVPFFKVRSLFVWILLLGFLIHFIPQQTRGYLYKAFTESPLVAKAFCFVLLVQVVLQIKSATVQPFIYFQF